MKNKQFILTMILLAQFVSRVGFALPNDPKLADQAHLSGTTGDLIGIEAAWSAVSSSEVIIAVIDSGIDARHEDLASNLWVNTAEIAGNGVDDDGNGYVDDVHGYDFYNAQSSPVDAHGHGTHVAGIIAAQGNNGVGTAGLLWDAQVMALRITNDENAGTISKAIEAIDYAVANGARVINLSWIFSDTINSTIVAFKEAVISYANAGIVFVAAAGNNGELRPDPSTELDVAFNEAIIMVGASDAQGALASLSNYGQERVHLLAPGIDILSTIPNDKYQFWSGTSQATPMVAAAAAMILEVKPTLTASDVKKLLIDSVNPDPALATVVSSGGILNIEKALEITLNKELSGDASQQLAEAANATSGDTDQNASDSQVQGAGEKSGGCTLASAGSSQTNVMIFVLAALFLLPLFVIRLVRTAR